VVSIPDWCRESSFVLEREGDDFTSLLQVARTVNPRSNPHRAVREDGMQLNDMMLKGGATKQTMLPLTSGSLMASPMKAAATSAMRAAVTTVIDSSPQLRKFTEEAAAVEAATVKKKAAEAEAVASAVAERNAVETLQAERAAAQNVIQMEAAADRVAEEKVAVANKIEADKAYLENTAVSPDVARNEAMKMANAEALATVADLNQGAVEQAIAVVNEGGHAAWYDVDQTRSAAWMS
jgi:hypothetical protein